jgi:hypothetical protein
MKKLNADSLRTVVTALMLFSQEHREEVKEENPGAPVTVLR